MTFMKYLAGKVSLISLPKTLLRNKKAFLASNLLTLAELVLNELKKTISESIY